MQGETVVCIAPRRWDSLWRESQQIMSRIARHNRVYYFEPGYAASPQSHLAELRRNTPNLVSLRAREVQDNVIAIPAPPTLPLARRHLPRPILRCTTPLVNAINARMLINHVRRAIGAFGIRAPILWINDILPQLVGQFGEKLSCYHNYDEVADFPLNTPIKELIRRADDQLTRRVGVVFATSQAQCRRRRSINANTHFLPNGVDFDTFNRALDPNLPLPADIASIPRPIIGFAGWLGHHIDVALLCRIAEAYPGCSLVLVGPDELPENEDRRRLGRLPNVCFLGKKEPWELPNYLRAFDVALMPWVLSRHVLSAYPLKLHEYLAAGRAVVSVALPELEPFHHVISIARSRDEYISLVRHALHDHDPQAVEMRTAVARENTWDHRVAEIYRILQHHVTETPNRAMAGLFGGNGEPSRHQL